MIKTLFVSVLVVLLGSLPAAPALGAQPITTDVQVPFSETVFYDLSNESLPLTGAMHVSTEVTPKGSLSVRINLDGVSGIGEITSIRYNAIGRDQASLPFATAITEDFDFRIIPADGFTLSCILRVKLALTFDSNGRLTSVDVEQASVVH